jgi:hypothetical protein
VSNLNADLVDGKSDTDFYAAGSKVADSDKLDGLDSTNFAAYKRTVLVSPVGTPQQNGTALRNALASITGASATNPYLLKIEPGIYDLGGSAADEAFCGHRGIWGVLDQDHQHKWR